MKLEQKIHYINKKINNNCEVRMKKILFITIIVAFISLISANNIMRKTLNNGMQLVVKENHSNQSVGYYCFVKTGSVNEDQYLGAGISHFLEHVVSGGTTEFRTEKEYTEEAKKIGAVVNAYTTQFMTAFHIVSDKEYKDKALKMLSEQITSCICDSSEVAREKEVILKEIVLRSTPPKSKFYQKYNELLYPNSNKRYPVIGYTELFKKISRKELQDYYNKRYVPNNMIFVCAGDIDAETEMENLTKTFKDFSRGQLSPVYQPVQNVRTGDLEYIYEFGVKQPILSLGYILPAAYYKDQLALESALRVLMEDRDSPIRKELSENRKLITELSYHVSGASYEPEGAIRIMIFPKNTTDMREVVEVIDKYVREYSQGGFTQEDIDKIKNRYIKRHEMDTPSLSSDCNRIGWNMLNYGIPEPYEMMLEKYEKLEPKDLSAALNKHLASKNRIVFYAVPKGKKTKLETNEMAKVEKTEIEKIEKDNLTILHKKNTIKTVVNCVVWLPIYNDYESVEYGIQIEKMFDLMFKGSENYEPEELTRWFEDHSVNLNTRINDNGAFLSFKCLKADLPKLKEIIGDALNNPIFAESELDLIKRKLRTRLKSKLSEPRTYHSDFVNKNIFKQDRYKASYEDKVNSFLELDSSALKSLYSKFFKADSAIVTIFGDIGKNKAVLEAQSIFDMIPKGKIKENRVKKIYELPNDEIVNKYDFEQVNINVLYPAPHRNNKHRVTVELITTLLSSGRGILHRKVREENDLAYFAAAYHQANDISGALYIISQTSFKKREQLKNVLTEVKSELKPENLTDEEIKIAIESNIKMLRSMLNDNNKLFYITHYEALGFGYDYLERKENLLKKVEKDDIKHVLNKFFNNPTILISEPSDDVKLMVD